MPYSEKDNEAQSTKIRELNDRFRKNLMGNGSFVITPGIQELGEDAIREIILAVRQFDEFTSNNDPYKEHDFGAIDVVGEKIFWKIDYYDQSLKYHSPNKADESLTRRVLTIMLASEY